MNKKYSYYIWSYITYYFIDKKPNTVTNINYIKGTNLSLDDVFELSCY